MMISDYRRALRRIEAENPAEPLLPALQQGHTALNEIYMRSALQRLADVPPAPGMTENPTSEPANDEKTDIEPAAGAPIGDLWSEKRRLWGEWAKTSNRFHECRTDAERAMISDQVADVWAQLQRVKSRIEHYEEHGTLPAPDERFPLPEDPVALVKKLQSIRAMISQAEAQLRALAELPDEHPDRAKIPDAERRRAELILYRDHAQTKIKNLQSGGLGEC
jgi:hypothetical protein